MSPTFKKGDVVVVSGKLFQGLGRVEGFCPAVPAGGEMSYSYSYSEPMPQVLVRCANGRGARYHGDDLKAGAVRVATADEAKKFVTGRTVRQWLQAVTIDDSLAAQQLGADDADDYVPTTAWDRASHNDVIGQLLAPFADMAATATVKDDDGDERPADPDGVTILLGEFDHAALTLTAEKEGHALRNSGVKAFTIRLHYDGYAPDTIALQTTEVLGWGAGTAQ